MAARAAAGRQFLVELRPSFARWLPASLDLHTWTFQGFLRSSWVELIVVVMVRVMEEGRGNSQQGFGLRRLPSHPHRPHQQHHLGQMHKLCGGKLDDSKMHS